MTGQSATKNIDELYTDAKRHIGLILLRVLLAIVMARAMSEAHMRWGEPYPGDGQQAFGFIVIFGLIGLAVAALYFGLGCLLQYLLRKRAGLWTVFVDFTVAFVLTGVLVHMGVTARYVDAETSSKPQQTQK